MLKIYLTAMKQDCFIKLSMPDRPLTLEKENCKGGKKSKDRLNILFCVNSTTGEEKLKPLVIGIVFVFNTSYNLLIIIVLGN